MDAHRRVLGTRHPLFGLAIRGTCGLATCTAPSRERKSKRGSERAVLSLLPSRFHVFSYVSLPRVLELVTSLSVLTCPALDDGLPARESARVAKAILSLFPSSSSLSASSLSFPVQPWSALFAGLPCASGSPLLGAAPVSEIPMDHLLLGCY